MGNTSVTTEEVTEVSKTLDINAFPPTNNTPCQSMNTDISTQISDKNVHIKSGTNNIGLLRTIYLHKNVQQLYRGTAFIIHSNTTLNRYYALTAATNVVLIEDNGSSSDNIKYPIQVNYETNIKNKYEFGVSNIFIHPKYFKNNEYNIAVLELCSVNSINDTDDILLDIQPLNVCVQDGLMCVAKLVGIPYINGNSHSNDKMYQVDVVLKEYKDGLQWMYNETNINIGLIGCPIIKNNTDNTVIGIHIDYNGYGIKLTKDIINWVTNVTKQLSRQNCRSIDWINDDINMDTDNKEANINTTQNDESNQNYWSSKNLMNSIQWFGNKITGTNTTDTTDDDIKIPTNDTNDI